MADNAGDDGGAWKLIMTNADRKREKKRPPVSRRKINRNALDSKQPTIAGFFPSASSITTNTAMLPSNPSSRGWETQPTKRNVNPGNRKPKTTTMLNSNTSSGGRETHPIKKSVAVNSGGQKPLAAAIAGRVSPMPNTTEV